MIYIHFSPKQKMPEEMETEELMRAFAPRQVRHLTTLLAKQIILSNIIYVFIARQSVCLLDCRSKALLCLLECVCAYYGLPNLTQSKTSLPKCRICYYLPNFRALGAVITLLFHPFFCLSLFNAEISGRTGMVRTALRGLKFWL